MRNPNVAAERPSHRTHPLHRRLTVVSVPAAEQSTFAARLAQALVGDDSSVDLRSISIVTNGDIATLALRLGPERASQRAAALERAEARLRAARQANHAAITRRDELMAAVTRLTADTAQCEGVAAHADELSRLVASATAEAEARRRDVESARQKLDQVLEQRHAGQAAMERAEHELNAVTDAGLDEPELRRHLEAASRKSHEAATEDKTVIRQREALERQLHELTGRRAALAAERHAVRWVASVPSAAIDRVANALTALDARPSSATPSLRARALADAIADVEARLEMVDINERRAGNELFETLASQHRGLLADAAELLGEHAGAETLARLRAVGHVPANGVDEVVAALSAVGIESTPTAAVQQAKTWLADARAAISIATRCDSEQADLDTHEARIAAAMAETERARERAAEAIESSRAETDAITAELTARAGGDDERASRLAEAQRLFDQVEAVRAALEDAEAAAREELDAAIAASSSADELCDRNSRLLRMAGQRARDLTEGLPPELQPELGPNPLDGISDLAAALRENLRRHQRDLTVATTETEVTTSEVERAVSAVDVARAVVAGEPGIEMAEALVTLIADRRSRRIIFEGAFDGAEPAVQQALLATAVEASATRAVVVLTADPEVLGWAIGLPPEIGVVATEAALSAAAASTAPPPHAEPATDQPLPVESAAPGGSPG